MSTVHVAITVNQGEYSAERSEMFTMVNGTAEKAVMLALADALYEEGREGLWKRFAKKGEALGSHKKIRETKGEAPAL